MSRSKRSNAGWTAWSRRRLVAAYASGMNGYVDNVAYALATPDTATRRERARDAGEILRWVL